jgi:hypothetical protein
MKIDFRMTLPAQFAERLRELHPRTGHRLREPQTQLRLTLAVARRKGWTLQALADGVGLTRERVRQIVAEIDLGQYTPVQIAALGEIPAPPPRPLTKEELARAARKPRLKLTGPEQDELRTLKRKAMANGVNRPDHPAVVAGLALAALINAYLARGYYMSEIAKACGVTKHAIRQRLGRYGYRSLPPSARPNRPGPIAAALAAEKETRS